LKRSQSMSIVFLGVAGLPAPRRLATAPTRHGSAILTPPRYNPFSYHSRSSRNSVRCLPFERDTVIGMQIFAYLWSYLFQIVHIFWTAHGCVNELVSLVCFDSRPGFGIISLLFSGYTLSLLGRVSGEHRGGATEILSPIGVEHEN
jgi:hypothetical protein